MALVEPDYFADQECRRVYIAGRLSEAKRVEHALGDAGVDYFIAIETFERRLFGVIRREYEGVAFYVPSDRAASSRERLLQAKLTAGLES